MAPSKKTWIWIIVSVLGACVLLLIGIAGWGVYYVSQHIDTERATVSEAGKAFDSARAPFKEQRPLIELDDSERPRTGRPLTDLPTSTVKPHELRILVWNPEEQRIVRLSLPFWLLRLGRDDVRVMDEGGFDFRRLKLDVDELERIGPALVMDARGRSGERVLVWTQ
jgi:hypothetical protein